MPAAVTVAVSVTDWPTVGVVAEAVSLVVLVEVVLGITVPAGVVSSWP